MAAAVESRPARAGQLSSRPVVLSRRGRPSRGLSRPRAHALLGLPSPWALAACTVTLKQQQRLPWLRGAHTQTPGDATHPRGPRSRHREWQRGGQEPLRREELASRPECAAACHLATATAFRQATEGASWFCDRWQLMSPGPACRGAECQATRTPPRLGSFVLSGHDSEGSREEVTWGPRRAGCPQAEKVVF